MVIQRKGGRGAGATVQQPSFCLPRSSLSWSGSPAESESLRLKESGTDQSCSLQLGGAGRGRLVEEDFLTCLNQIKPRELGSTPSLSFQSIYCTFCTSSECKKSKVFDKMPPVSGTEKVDVCVCVPIYW